MTKQERIDGLRAEAEAVMRNACAQGVNVVLGDGDLDAGLMLVGEAPGADEDRLRKPFVGVSGKLLNEELAMAGLSRERIYITSCVKCRPTVVKNEKTYNRAPTRREIAAWHALLMRQIEIIDPQVILCIGSVAASALIHRGFKMREERGKWFEGVTGVPTMATFHPAYIHRWKRSPDMVEHQQFREDLRAAATR